MVWLSSIFSKLITCKHEFNLSDLGARDKISGKVTWRCHKCLKIFTMDYGLQVNKYGEIINNLKEEREGNQ